MKNKGSTFFKVSGVLAIISGAIYCLGFVVIFPLIIGVPLIIGGVQFSKYAEFTDEQIKENSGAIITWIVVFFFGGILTGVLALVGYLMVVNSQTENKPQNNSRVEVSGTTLEDETKGETDDIGKIERLNKLKEQGLITLEEYETLKKQILNK